MQKRKKTVKKGWNRPLSQTDPDISKERVKLVTKPTQNNKRKKMQKWKV